MKYNSSPGYEDGGQKRVPPISPSFPLADDTIYSLRQF